MFVKGNELHLVWCTQDVEQACKDIGVNLPEEHYIKVLESVLDRHDCNYGISWEDFYNAIRDIIEDEGLNETEENEDEKNI